MTWQKIATLIASIAAVGAILTAVYQEIAYGPTARAKVPALKAEADSIAPPIGDVLVQQLATHKSSHALVDRTYTSQLDYARLRSHYDAELAGHGWRFIREKPMRDWGRDLGGKDACYRKGEDIASLQYAGERANYGWTYSINFSWGLVRCGAP